MRVAVCVPTSAASARPRTSATSGSSNCWEPHSQRHLRSSSVEIGLRGEADKTLVSVTSKQVLRGMSRLGSPLMRRGQGAILEEALDGIERALGADVK